MPSETQHFEPLPTPTDLQYIDDLIAQYVAETSDPEATWRSANPKPAIKDIPKLRSMAQKFATRLTQQHKRIQTHLSESALRELVEISNDCLGEVEILEETDERINCVMYGLTSVGIPHQLNRFSKANVVYAILDTTCNEVTTTAADFEFQNNDVVILEPVSNAEDLHFIVVQKTSTTTTFKSKLGALFVVANADINDLLSMYHTQKWKVYRKK